METTSQKAPQQQTIIPVVKSKAKPPLNALFERKQTEDDYRFERGYN